MTTDDCDRPNSLRELGSQFSKRDIQFDQSIDVGARQVIPLGLCDHDHILAEARSSSLHPVSTPVTRMTRNHQSQSGKGRSMNLFVLRTWLEAKFAKDEKGASMVEYILLVALIALAVIAAVVFLKNQVNNKFNDAGSKLSSSGS
jgi:Flp pilus assembly pilin Flp